MSSGATQSASGRAVLEGVTVVDLTTELVGPYATKLLGGFGAEVIKIEDPRGGDPARRWSPFPGDVPHPEKSGMFLHLNLNKKGTTLNIGCATGRKVLSDLIRHADILVEGLSARDRERLGLDYSSTFAHNPKLVHTSVTPFGTTGPYRDYKATDVMVYAMGGQMTSQGQPDREPINLASNVVMYMAGLQTALGTMAAFSAIESLGRGQHVDISMVEALSSSADGRTNALVQYQFSGENTKRTREGVRGFPFGIYPCADGYVFLWGTGFWPQSVKMLGMPELLKDPRFCTPEAQAQPGHREEFDAILLPWLLARTKQEIWKTGMEAGILLAPLNTTLDTLADPHFQQRGAWATVDHPALGHVTVPGRPLLMSEGSWRITRPAPLLGQHTEEVLGRLGYNRQDLVRMRAAGVI